MAIETIHDSQILFLSKIGTSDAISFFPLPV